MTIGPDDYAHFAQFRREFREAMARFRPEPPGLQEEFYTNSLTGNQRPGIRDGARPITEILDEVHEFEDEPEAYRHNVDPEDWKEKPVARHEFVQDRLFETRVCEKCGMWPKYHTHTIECTCAECDPEGYVWENMTSTCLPGYGDEQYDSSEYGGKPDTFRPHP